MSPRTRRLQQDNKELHALFSGGDSIIRIMSEDGIPSDKYVISYYLKGLYLDDQDDVKERDYHEMEVYLPLEYPRGQPQLRMLTPVFHPNIDPTHVCQGDFWGAEERLEDLIVRIAQLISYQDFNLKSPLDGKAAEWTEKNLNSHIFPIDSRDVFPASKKEFFSQAPWPVDPEQITIKLDGDVEDDLGIRILDTSTDLDGGQSEEEVKSFDGDDLGIRILGAFEEVKEEEKAHFEDSFDDKEEEPSDPSNLDMASEEEISGLKIKMEKLVAENTQLRERSVETLSNNGASEEVLWLLDHQDNQVGPFTLKEVCRRIGAGQTELNDFAWMEGLATWIPLRQLFAEFFE
jgi:ubiquitin-protein ligase